MALVPLDDVVRCRYCGQRPANFKCPRCRALHYCSPEHRSADEVEHQLSCSAVCKWSYVINLEAANLRHYPDDAAWRANGHYKSRYEYICEHMRSRVRHLDALGMENCPPTRAAMEEILSCALTVVDMYHIGRVSGMAMHLLILVGRDQEAYDWIQALARTGPSQAQDPSNADVFARCTVPCVGDTPRYTLAAIILIKLRLLLDIQSSRKLTPFLGTRLPYELHDLVRNYVPRSTVLVGEDALLRKLDREPLQHRSRTESLKEQIDQLLKDMKGQTIGSRASCFWHALLDVAGSVHAYKEAWHMREQSNFEARLQLQMVQVAWMENPGAMEFIQRKLDFGDLKNREICNECRENHVATSSKS